MKEDVGRRGRRKGGKEEEREEGNEGEQHRWCIVGGGTERAM